MAEKSNPENMHGEERKEELQKKPVPTEISETVYMGEGKSGVDRQATELTETAYMGEPEKPSKLESEDEYKRSGEKMGKANLPPRKDKHGNEAA
jgi:hypothetical protein